LTVTPQDAPVVDVPEGDFRSALRRLSQDAELIAFLSPPGPRLRLVPASFTPEDPFTSGYRQLCAARGKPADCLELLGDGVFGADDRQSIATSIALRSVLAGVALELGRSVDPDRVYVMVTSAMVGFMVMLAFPDPVTKIVLAALALTAIAYIGWDTFYAIREGWAALKRRCESAAGFADLRVAGEEFGTIVGENVGRILVMLVVAAMGASLGSFTARLGTLPGFARAAQMFQLRLGLSFSALSAGQVTGVTITDAGVTVALASGVAMSSISDDGSRKTGSVVRGPPARGNYRGRFNAARVAQGKPRLPEDWEAHHRIPQAYRDHPELKDFDFDAPQNIRGVKGYKADVNIHQKVTERWLGFDATNPRATRAEIESFARTIDAEFAAHWWP
jgi:hypothetical protein